MDSLAPYRDFLAAVPSTLLRRLPATQRARLDFTSNDYCDATRNPMVIHAAARAAQRFGTGSTGSRLLSGVQALHQIFERRIARDLGMERALLFSSGWQGNVAVVAALLQAAPPAQTHVYCDRLIHASLHDAVRLGGHKQIRFQHNNLRDLARRLTAQAPATRTILITESLFSMDGDVADTQELFALMQQHDALCIIDEAHALGVQGPRGLGYTAVDTRHPGERDPRIVVLGTLSKALGSSGGFVACSATIADYLVQACRGFMFATAPAPPQIAAAWAAWRMISHGAADRRQLAERAAALRAALHSRGFATGDSHSNIIPIITGDVATALRLRDGLAQHGIAVSLIRPPTVAANACRLRLALRMSHTDEHMHIFLTALDALQ